MDYTPTTEKLREMYEWATDDPARHEGFDRWLAEHDREVEARGLEKAADFREGLSVAPHHDMVTAWLRDRAQQVRENN